MYHENKMVELAAHTPLFWGSWKGRVIKAIVIDSAETWSEILDSTGLSSESLNTALSELYAFDVILKTEEETYAVEPTVCNQYKEFFKLPGIAGTQKTAAEFPTQRRDELAKWIDKWKDVKKLDFSSDYKHFFLWGRYLDDISKDLISHARSEVLVVNPYVDNCDLSNTLTEASKNGTIVQLVTRPPNIKQEPTYRRKKQDYHKKLKEAGIVLIYNEMIHAKIIVVDRAVAVVSSMNFYSASSSGSSWEAGLITLEIAVVESIANYVLELVEKPESTKFEMEE